ncbi:hypothetical protein JW935_01710 [candidate division KSB1 bacterium]|nr:hypothetical protein [candidate division KSB1 bacterium]
MKKFLLAICVLAFSVTCEKSPNDSDDQDVNAQFASAQEAASAVPIFMESSMTAFAATKTVNNLAKIMAPADTLLPDEWTCPYIIWDKDTRALVLDYGTGCMGNDERIRSGKISITISGSLLQGVSITLDYENYSVDQTTLSGSVTVTGQGTQMIVTIAGGQVKNENGTWSVDATLSVTAVLGDLETLDDDYYMIEGAGTVKDAENKSYTFTITEPLSMSINCEYPMMGKMEISVSMAFTAMVDYFPEKGDCDDIVEITIGKTSRTVHLGGNG